MLNIRRIPPRFAAGPPLPIQADNFVEGMKRALPRLADDEEEEEHSLVVPPAPDVPIEWELTLPASKGGRRKNVSEDIIACTMGAGGDLITAVGAKGSVWLWQRIIETTI